MKRHDHIVRPLIFFSTILFVLIGTYFVIRYAKGDRLAGTGAVRGTGLLAANSFPTSAQVYINGRLTTATDNTLNLDPGDYLVEIKKDGYHTWSKNLAIQKELVTPTNAQLFPTSVSLEPLTYTGAHNPTPSADGGLLAFAVASSSSSTKNGLYIQDLNTGAISLNKNARQIAQNTTEHDYAKANYLFSPNSSELLVSFQNGAHLLLDVTRFNNAQELEDITWKLSTILADWELEIARTERVRLIELPDFFQELATSSGNLTNLYFSPDGKKLLYQALTPITIPNSLITPPPATSTQPENRSLNPGSWYIYDLIEDKNFLISQGSVPSPSPSPTPKNSKIKPPQTNNQPVISKIMLLDTLAPIPAETTSSPSAFRKLQKSQNESTTLALMGAQYSPIYVDHIQWYPDSLHVIIHTGEKIEIMEYDATNRLTLYAGPFDSSIIYPWPDGSKIITRIQFSEGTIPNLYTIKLK
ncbi:MAG: PEGA domain-containing protein [Candidatus Moraniibacteriota bacterium]|nr:MAG: PEGA domain-containing protein [Candidatus Moranbacteria bacterium]